MSYYKIRVDIRLSKVIVDNDVIYERLSKVIVNNVAISVRLLKVIVNNDAIYKYDYRMW